MPWPSAPTASVPAVLRNHTNAIRATFQTYIFVAYSPKRNGIVMLQSGYLVALHWDAPNGVRVPNRARGPGVFVAVLDVDQ